MTDMRKLMSEAVVGARDRLMSAAVDLDAGNVLSDDEQLREYESMRGNPRAILNFTAQRVGPGGDVFAEAQRYEEAMEDLWTRRTGR